MSVWNLTGDDAYVNPPKRHRLPRWFIPSLTVIVLVVLIFWGIPGVVAQLSVGRSPDGNPQETEAPLFSPQIRVVTARVADVFDRDDVFADRITQVLYNDPVEVLHDNTVTFGFVRVRLMDGYMGFMRDKDLLDNRVSIEPARHSTQILVTDLTKRILSHESNGTIVAEVMMGTRLLSDYKGSGVYRVTMPNGDKGWMGANGVMEIPLEDDTDRQDGDGRYFASTALSFISVPFVENGISRYGASPEGIAFIAGSVNGIALPRTLPELLESGFEIPLRYDDEDSRELDFDSFQRGDLFFFTDTPVKFISDDDTILPVRLGIYVDYGQVLSNRTGRADIRIISLNTDTALAERLFAVRRLFPDN